MLLFSFCSTLFVEQKTGLSGGTLNYFKLFILMRWDTLLKHRLGTKKPPVMTYFGAKKRGTTALMCI
ncbi:hypothetical protein H1P_6410001 [Hyella patelloides LEGE 07179]|uniref:Uncharacterized protein n=1 Tax=Hyella patelloides LEGE 07179 TaxID=945734 RepID=A0A563W282_9CYAN|nr:hypothetical protein H1P_6410001 [Hyella patelloides LEGE 07179]